MTTTHRDVPRHRGSLASQPIGQPTRPTNHENRSSQHQTPIRTHGYTADELARIEASEQRHARGIPILGPISGAGTIPGTNPGRTHCAECGAHSGHHHHRQCNWTGRLP